MRAIFCLGTRDSNYRSSLSEVRTKKLLSAYDVVLNERHFSDVLEENLTCTWDVWLKASSLAHVVKKLIRSVEERPYVVKDKPFKTPHTLIAFYWHGSDRHGRPPEHMREVIERLIKAFEAAGFEITRDMIPQDRA